MKVLLRRILILACLPHWWRRKTSWAFLSDTTTTTTILEFSFDSWIRTKSGTQFKYNYPSGLSPDEANVDYLPATPLPDQKQWVSYKYYEGGFKSSSELSLIHISEPTRLGMISYA